MESEIANNLLGSNCPDHGVEARDSFTNADVANKFGWMDTQLMIVENSNRHKK